MNRREFLVGAAAAALARAAADAGPGGWTYYNQEIVTLTPSNSPLAPTLNINGAGPRLIFYDYANRRWWLEPLEPTA